MMAYLNKQLLFFNSLKRSISNSAMENFDALLSTKVFVIHSYHEYKNDTGAAVTKTES